MAKLKVVVEGFALGSEALEKLALERLLHAHSQARLTNQKEIVQHTKAALEACMRSNEDYKDAYDSMSAAYVKAQNGRRTWKLLTFVASTAVVVLVLTR